MNILLFGGSFNPPSLAHYQLVKNIYDLNFFNEIWVIPCYEHNFNKEFISFKHRFNMCKSLFHQIAHVKNFEEMIQSKSTFESVEFLKTEFPFINFYFLMGMDNVNSFTSWKNYEYLLQNLNFVIGEISKQWRNTKKTAIPFTMVMP